MWCGVCRGAGNCAAPVWKGASQQRLAMFLARGVLPERSCCQNQLPKPALALHPPFSLCAQFEESLISAKMEQAADEEEDGGGVGGGNDDGEDFLLTDDGHDLDMRWVKQLAVCVSP